MKPVHGTRLPDRLVALVEASEWIDRFWRAGVTAGPIRQRSVACAAAPIHIHA